VPAAQLVQVEEPASSLNFPALQFEHVV